RRHSAAAFEAEPWREDVPKDCGDAGRERWSQQVRRGAAGRGPARQPAGRDPAREARNHRRREPLEGVEQEDEGPPPRTEDPKRVGGADVLAATNALDRKSTRLNSSHVEISYAVFCLKKKTRQRYY